MDPRDVKVGVDRARDIQSELDPRIVATERVTLQPFAELLQELRAVLGGRTAIAQNSDGVTDLAGTDVGFVFGSFEKTAVVVADSAGGIFGRSPRMICFVIESSASRTFLTSRAW